MKGRNFIMRSIISTAICEMIFNLVTYPLTYYKILSTSEILTIIINSWTFKVFYSLIAVIPFAVLIYYLKKHENIDIYDKDTDYNPFKFGLND